jgi:hypothetical protein
MVAATLAQCFTITQAQADRRKLTGASRQDSKHGVGGTLRRVYEDIMCVCQASWKVAGSRKDEVVDELR